MLLRRSILVLRGKSGSEMVGAAISLPVAILAAMLLVRTFVFYMEILSSGIGEHMDALREQDAYRGALIRIYSDTETVSMLRGGLLRTGVSKELKTRAYLINEDIMVRSGEILD